MGVLTIVWVFVLVLVVFRIVCTVLCYCLYGVVLLFVRCCVIVSFMCILFLFVLSVLV